MPNSYNVVRRLEIVRDRQKKSKRDYDDARHRYLRARDDADQADRNLQREEASGTSQARASISLFTPPTFVNWSESQMQDAS